MPGAALTLVRAGAEPVVLPSATSSLPPAIYQFVPHTPFAAMEAKLPEVAAMGFSAVQLPPVHPPSTTMFEHKIGSAYAPRDLEKVSPFLYVPGLTVDQYISGDYREPIAEAGWFALRRFCKRANELGLKVVGDLVFAHTARDADVVEAHTQRFGNGFYKDGQDGVSGARREDGSFDNWNDVIAIDHAGPAREAIIAHCDGVVQRFLESGVTVFRADAAPRMDNGFWRRVISGAGVFAETRGLERPVFYAEALESNVDGEAALVREAGFDGVTTSLHWWRDLKSPWLLERSEAVRRAGGAGVSFVDNHDTDRAVNTFHSLQGVIAQMALTAFMSSSMTVLDGTTNLASRRASVFLRDYQPVSDEVHPMLRGREGMMKDLVEMLLGIKAEYAVFRTPAYTELTYDGSPIVRVRRTTSTGQVEIAVNVGMTEGVYYVPAVFSRGNIFGVNSWNGQPVWFGATPDIPIAEYHLAPGGIAVFHRNISSAEDLKVPA